MKKQHLYNVTVVGSFTKDVLVIAENEEVALDYVQDICDNTDLITFDAGLPLELLADDAEEIEVCGTPEAEDFRAACAVCDNCAGYGHHLTGGRMGGGCGCADHSNSTRQNANDRPFKTNCNGHCPHFWECCEDSYWDSLTSTLVSAGKTLTPEMRYQIVRAVLQCIQHAYQEAYPD